MPTPVSETPKVAADLKTMPGRRPPQSPPPPRLTTPLSTPSSVTAARLAVVAAEEEEEVKAGSMTNSRLAVAAVEKEEEKEELIVRSFLKSQLSQQHRITAAGSQHQAAAEAA